MGLQADPHFSSYHQVFNRAAWSPRRVARRLLSAAIAAFVPEGVGLTFAIDETLERRWGKKIRIRGHYRDPLASSKERSVSASGIRWIVLALVVTVPWASRPWALPVLSLPSPTPKVSLKLGRRHKTIAERARQVIDRLPNLDVVLADPKTAWSKATVRWYDGAEREMEVTTGTAVWYHNGMEPLP